MNLIESALALPPYAQVILACCYGLVAGGIVITLIGICLPEEE